MCKQELLEELRQKGFRITPQRVKILGFFEKLPEGDHLSAEEIQALLKQNDIQVSLATLYRTLKFLASHNMLRELDFGEDHKHYELITEGSNHHHFICSKCNKAFEFSDEGIFNHVKKAAVERQGFLVTDYQFKIFGICQACQNN